MKNIVLMLLAFIGLCSTQMNAQNDGTFDNGTRDHSWNNKGNWDSGKLPKGIATILFDVDLNGNQSIKQIKTAGNNDITVTGEVGDVLTLKDGLAIENSINNEFHFDCDITIIKKITTILNGSGIDSKLVFSRNRTIDLGSNRLIISNEEPTNPVEFYGNLLGDKEFYINGFDTDNYGGVTFKNTADNTNYTGLIRTYSKPIISDIVSPQMFLPATGVLQINQGGGTVTLNGANTMEGTIERAGWSTGTGEGIVVFNASQENMASLSISGDDEMLTFNIDSSVEKLWFLTSNISSNCTLNIVGFEDGVLGFGNTVSQTVLDTWLLDGVESADGTFIQDDNGYIRRRVIWTGATDNNWSKATNWKDDLVPTLTATKKVEIPSGLTNYPIITAGQTLIINASLTIEAGAKITINGVINNTGTITNNGDLILVSTISGTGYLVSIDKSVANVTLQRYSSSNQRGWRTLGNPLETVTFGNLAANSATPFTLGNNASGAYDSETNTWTSSNDAANMLSQQAYNIFIRGIAGEGDGGTYTEDPSHVTVAIKGTARNTAPDEIDTTAGEYYLVANPYTAPVSLATILAASSGLSTGVSYYDPTQGSTDVKIKAGGYWTDIILAGTVSGSLYDVVLPPMGAIFVQATAAGTINVPTTAIYTGSVNNLYVYNHKSTKEHKTTDDNTIKLTMEVVSNGVKYDKLALQFKEEGTEGSNIDFGKLQNTILDFFHVTEDTIEMAVSELELKEQTIPLGIYSYAFQNFTIHIAENSIPLAYEAILKDALLNTSTLLTTEADYSFDLTSASETQGYERFSIVLKSTGTLSVEEDVLNANIQVYPNPARERLNLLNNGVNGETSFEIYTLTGQLVHAIKAQPNTTTTINVTGWAAGIYMLKAMNNETSTTKKIIIQ